jgi:hypothetical protein
LWRARHSTHHSSITFNRIDLEIWNENENNSARSMRGSGRVQSDANPQRIRSGAAQCREARLGVIFVIRARVH